MLSDTFLWILYQLLEHSEPLSSQIAKEGSRMNTFYVFNSNIHFMIPIKKMSWFILFF